MTDELETAWKPAYLKLIGQRIRSARQALAMNQDDFAAVAGLHRAYVGQLENGSKDLRISTLYKVAVALRISPCDLLPGEWPYPIERE